jgi:hypothetical protein
MASRYWANDELKLSANLIGRTPSSIAMKLVNLASLDPDITGTGRRRTCRLGPSQRVEGKW